MEVRESAAVIQLELKYCERCGGLFLRQLGIGELYCAGCAEQMSDSRSMPKARSRPRLPVNRDSRGLFEVAKRAGTGGGKA
jgi:hypothetical protein